MKISSISLISLEMQRKIGRNFQKILIFLGPFERFLGNVPISVNFKAMFTKNLVNIFTIFILQFLQYAFNF